MGEVYRARDPRLNREVAIKVLPEGLASDATALARFEREARAVAALSHPNILDIHDMGDTGRRLMGRDRAARRRDALAPPHGGRSPLAQGRRDRSGDRGGSRRGARTGSRPPRHQALERLPHDGRPREDPRLRDRDVRGASPGTGATGGKPHGLARRRRHGRIPLARADPEKAGGRTQRHLLARLRDLRDGHRPARLSRRDRSGRHRRHAPLRARRSGRPRSGHSRGPSPPDRAVPRKALPRDAFSPQAISLSRSRSC